MSKVNKYHNCPKIEKQILLLEILWDATLSKELKKLRQKRRTARPAFDDLDYLMGRDLLEDYDTADWDENGDI